MNYSLIQKQTVRLHPIQERWLIFKYLLCNQWFHNFKKNAIIKFVFSLSCVALFVLITYKSAPMIAPFCFFGFGLFLVMKCGWIRAHGGKKDNEDRSRLLNV